MATGPLNVLFILADQFRPDCLGIAGNPVIRTPHLDALAREGTLFQKCFVQTAPCGPSRMCIYTGRYLCSTRAVDNKTPLIDAEENLAMALREGGYAPGIIGYNDYAVDPRILPADDPRTQEISYDNFLPGFDLALRHEYDSPEYFEMLRRKGYPEALLSHEAIHRPNVPPRGPGDHLPLRYPAHYRAEDSEGRFVTQAAIDYLRERRDAGWVLSLNTIKPHPPRICAAPYNDMYDPSDMPAPNRRPEELTSTHPYLKQVHRQPQLVSERDLRETQANYYGMITELDACLGLLFRALKESGQWDRTLILFSSDHGEYLGDHYLTGKGQFYDETMRAPLIVRDPSPEADATRGAQLDRFVESIDLAPTILEYLGLPVPDRFQGQSVLGQVRGRLDTRPKTEIFYEKDFRSEMRHVAGQDLDRCLLWVVRDDAYKLVHFADASVPPLLFDLKRDPGEHHDLAGAPGHLPVLLAYSQKLLRWRMRHEDQRMEHWAWPHRHKPG